MKVLLTGGSGFIGRSIIDKIVTDRNNDSIILALRKEDPSLFGLSSIVTGDLGNNFDWKPVAKGCDVIIHCSARVHVMQDTKNDPLEEYRKSNVDGTLRLAKQAALAGVKRFIFLSSIKVNGEETFLNHCYQPDDQPLPQDPYGISKWEAEQGLKKISEETNMEVVIIRPPLVYGPGVKANFLNMMTLIYKGIPLPFGAINNQRSLVFIDNLVDLIMVCLDHPCAANQTFLVSDGNDLSTTELFKKIAVELDVKQKIFPVPMKLLKFGANAVGKKSIAQRLCGSLCVDITKTRELLNWQPPISLDKAISETTKDFLIRKSS